ncbi:MAG: hypothetical protein GY880_00875 [Planctomycetaceae bacterium]|nr:hypothetical protein [Planctomycetaceae bacterium]
MKTDTIKSQENKIPDDQMTGFDQAMIRPLDNVSSAGFVQLMAIPETSPIANKKVEMISEYSLDFCNHSSDGSRKCLD